MLRTPDTPPRQVITLPEIHAAIQAEVSSLASIPILDFDSVGAFLFIEDPYSHLLEPVFDSHERPYDTLDPVATTYRLPTSDTGVSHSIQDAGVASIAYDDGTAFTQDPSGDERIGRFSKALHNTYNIRGSMMAVRLDDAFSNRIGVVVVHSASKLLGQTPEHEAELLSVLRSRLDTLHSLLQLRREFSARQELERCQEFLAASMRHSRTPRTVARACADFVQSCGPIFQAKELFIRVQQGDAPGEWHPRPTDSQASALDQFAMFVSEEQGFTLNRPRQAPSLADAMSAAFGGSYVWCRADAAANSLHITCIANRKAESILNHWQYGDVALLHRAIEVFAGQLARAYHFDQLLAYLANLNGSDVRQERFQFISHILHDYFGFDQVLLAKVKKKSDRYRICTEFTAGFKKNEDALKKRPKDYLPAEPLPDTPDVMIRITSDFLNNRLRTIYPDPAFQNSQTNDFSLDSDLIETCDLRGRMYFVPCCTSGEATQQPTLECILHVGSSDGAVTIEEESIPLMKTLSNRVAEWLIAERSRASSAGIREIRNLDVCDSPTMQRLSEKVATATASLGCTIFINAADLPLLGLGWVAAETIADAMLCLVNFFDDWQPLFGTDGAKRLVGMFSSFFGIDAGTCERLLSSPGSSQNLARLAAEVVYVKVAQSNQPCLTDVFHDTLEEYGRCDDKVFAETFGRFVLNNVYLPGYGLTGWVLRYRQQMSLADKTSRSLQAFYDSVKAHIDQPWKRPLLTALHAARVDDSTLESAEIAAPFHADHISEDPARQAPQETYAACPIEGIEHIDRPVGVIRISNSASMRRGFNKDDEATLLEAARHVSTLLRREYMRGKSYQSKYLDRHGDEENFFHCTQRLSEKMEAFQKFLRTTTGAMTPQDRNDLQSVVDRLNQLCDSVNATPYHRVLALRIRSIDPAQLGDPRTIVSCLKPWLTEEKLAANVLVGKWDSATRAGPDVITMAFRVVHEIARNLARYQQLTNPTIIVSCENGVTFTIGAAEALEAAGDAEWNPYIKLVEGKEPGGGTKLILEAADLARVESEYAMVEMGNKQHMIARVSHHLDRTK